MVRQPEDRSRPLIDSPRLAWAGRGRAVVLGADGRWGYGSRAAGARRLDPPPPAVDTNLLVHGEAMEALLALAETHAARFRLCYIDPPYNTGSDHAAYRDRVEHGVWLACLEERLRATLPLLVAGGFLVVHVNEVEQAHLRCLLDELCGESARVAQIAWQRAPDRTVLGQGAALVPDHLEYLLVYAPHGLPRGWSRPQRLAPFPAKTLATYARALTPSPGSRLHAELTDGAGGRVRIHRHDGYSLERGRADLADFERRMRLTNQQPESTFQQALLARMPERGVLYRAEYVQRRGKHAGARSRFYLDGNVVLWLRDVARRDPTSSALTRVADLDNLWTAEEIPVTGVAGEGGVSFRRGKKPERLLARVIEAFSRPGELVLDFFAGSGTTGAVAARLGRGFVLVEAGAQALELCLPRLRRAGGKPHLARVSQDRHPTRARRAAPRRRSP